MSQRKTIIKKRRLRHNDIPSAPPQLTSEEDVDFKLALKLQEQYDREIQTQSRSQIPPTPECNIRYEQDLAYNRSLEADRKKKDDKLEQENLQNTDQDAELEKELTIEELRQIRISKFTT
jgi:hypothetical protein